VINLTKFVGDVVTTVNIINTSTKLFADSQVDAVNEDSLFLLTTSMHAICAHA
jgi:hypothetical protein